MDDKLSSGPSAEPTLHFLDAGSLGRGEVVRLFLTDAGIDFKDIRYAFDATWTSTSKNLRDQGLTLTGKLPTLDYKGHLLIQHLAILRYLSRELNEYDGATSYEKYLVDSLADLYNDWRAQWTINLSAPSEEYKHATIPKFHNIFAAYYAKDTTGPFLLGKTITYVDFAVYQAIDNDKVIGALSADAKLPTQLEGLIAAIEARPRVAAYLAANRKVGSNL